MIKNTNPAASAPACRPLDDFIASLQGADLVDRLRSGLIGDGVMIDGPYGPRPLIYADHVASGRALRQVEQFVADHILPFYANSHTQASYCGGYITRLREAGRAHIARIVHAGADCSVIFAGAGATAGVNRIVNLLDIPAAVRRGDRVVVLVGPYEHHSNLLPWRESGATVHEMPEAATGGPDLAALELALQDAKGAALVVGAFSAASNVTGIVTDTDAVTRLLKRYGALAVWDYAGGAPYLPMLMQTAPDAAKDAIVFSAHKFPGGPAASGVLICRDTIVRRSTPTISGGGTVSYVTPWDHLYSPSVTAREEAGTPNVIGDIRAALVLLIKEAVGTDRIAARNRDLRAHALRVWQANPALELLGNPNAAQVLPIFAFRVRDPQGGIVHHQLFTRMLSDVTGIQARGGCACAGSYAHRLLALDRAASDQVLAALTAGLETQRPGWVRLNLSYLNADAKTQQIIHGLDQLAKDAMRFASDYDIDTSNARFSVRPATGTASAEGVVAR
ncbi:MAG: aminotransferase class V-fold PLP-dependent enzyme [Pseudomonadota bacterium]